MSDTARHEAAHATLATMLGAKVVHVDRIGDGSGVAGRTLFWLGDQGRERDTKMAAIALAALLEDGTPPAWPPPGTSQETDIKELAERVDRLGLTWANTTG